MPLHAAFPRIALWPNKLQKKHPRCASFALGVTQRLERPFGNRSKKRTPWLNTWCPSSTPTRLAVGLGPKKLALRRSLPFRPLLVPPLHVCALGDVCMQLSCDSSECDYITDQAVLSSPSFCDVTEILFHSHVTRPALSTLGLRFKFPLQ